MNMYFIMVSFLPRILREPGFGVEEYPVSSVSDHVLRGLSSSKIASFVRLGVIGSL